MHNSTTLLCQVFEAVPFWNFLGPPYILFMCVAKSETTANCDEVDQVKLLEAVKNYRPHSVRYIVT